MPKPFPYKIGDKYNSLTIIDIERGGDRTRLTCECDCGNIKGGLHPHKVKSGKTKTCGCGAHDFSKQTTHGLSYTPEYRMWVTTKSRANKEGIAFDIEISDIVIPEFCPLLGIRLIQGGGWATPSLDKLIPSKGYVKGNILVMSKRANTIKNNATIDELMLLTDNLHNILTE